MSRRRILMTADVVGGVWTHALDLARGLAAEGVTTVLAVPGPAPDAAQLAEAATIPDLALRLMTAPLDWLAEQPAEVLAAGQALTALAAHEAVDLVQLNSPAFAAGARFDVPVLGVCHSCVATWWQAVRGTAPPAAFAWRDALLHQGYAACDALVAPTRAFADATAQVYGFAPPRTVHNGRQPPPAHAARRAGFVFTAGRLWDDGKDAATLDRAAARLPVLAAGPVQGPNGAAFHARHLRLAGRLDAAGVAGILARGPIFASVARYEPFGLAVLEAAQAGCALVLSNIPTFRELWDGAAVFVPPQDDAALGDAILGLLQDRERRAAFCIAARERSRRYGVEEMTRGMLQIHHELLRDGMARRGAAA